MVRSYQIFCFEIIHFPDFDTGNLQSIFFIKKRIFTYTII